MAEENVQEESQGGGMKKWIAILVILLIFIGAEVGLAVFFVDKLKPEDPSVKALKEQEELDKREKEQMTEMGATLEKSIDVTVNVANTEGGRYLKASVQLEYEPSFVKLGGVLADRTAKITNIIIDILSSRPIAELLTIEGKKKIREAIVADVNMILPDAIDGEEVGKVRRCFFVEFILQ